jgi:hypothetical protein
MAGRELVEWPMSVGRDDWAPLPFETDPEGFRDNLLRLLEEDFDAHGRSAIEAVRVEKPYQYLRLIVDLLPKTTGSGRKTIVGEIRRIIVYPKDRDGGGIQPAT